MVSQLGMIRKKKIRDGEKKKSRLNFFIETETPSIGNWDHHDSIQAIEMEAES